MASTTKRQHIVPRSYLDGFLPKGSATFWQFDKCNSSAAARPVLPKDAAVEKHFYSIKTPNGEWDDSAEKRLATIEGRALPLLRSLKNPSSLSSQERIDIGYFLAAQFRRTRAARRDSNAYCKTTLESAPFREWFANSEAEELTERYGKDIAGVIVQKIRDGTLPRVGDQEAKAQAIEVWIEGLSRYALEFSGWYWEVVSAPRHQAFVSSDSPAFVRRYSKIGNAQTRRKAASIEVEFHFPIDARRLLLLCENHRPEVSVASQSRFKELLRLQIENADRFVYSPLNCSDIANLVAKYSNTGPLSICASD